MNIVLSVNAGTSGIRNTGTTLPNSNPPTPTEHAPLTHDQYTHTRIYNIHVIGGCLPRYGHILTTSNMTVRHRNNTHQLRDLQVSGYRVHEVLEVELHPAERSARRLGAGRFGGGRLRLRRRRCDRTIDGDNGFVHHTGRTVEVAYGCFDADASARASQRTDVCHRPKLSATERNYRPEKSVGKAV